MIGAGIYLIGLDIVTAPLLGPFAPFVSGTWAAIGVCFVAGGIGAIAGGVDAGC
jgi:hypothetical protein